MLLLLLLHWFLWLWLHLAENGTIKGSLTGIPTDTVADKFWLIFQALGDIAFSYPYSILFLEIQVPYYIMHIQIGWAEGYIRQKKERIYSWNKVLNYFFIIKGHSRVSSTRKSDHEKGLNGCNLHHNILLLVLWMLWICSFWTSHTRKSLNRPFARFWVLWAFLARWPC